MSSDAAPITSARFAAALKDLSIGSLHAKVAELRNSIGHLRDSNKQMEDFLRAQPDEQRADPDLVDAIHENREVVARMEGRIAMVKAEVEDRGMPWPTEEEGEGIVGNGVIGTAGDREGQRQHSNGDAARDADVAARPPDAPQQSGRLSDEELARRMRERMDDMDDGAEEGGLHL
jgi:hypothetical protein